MRFKLYSTENLRSFEKHPTPPWKNIKSLKKSTKILNIEIFFVAGFLHCTFFVTSPGKIVPLECFFSAGSTPRFLVIGQSGFHPIIFPKLGVSWLHLIFYPKIRLSRLNSNFLHQIRVQPAEPTILQKFRVEPDLLDFLNKFGFSRLNPIFFSDGTFLHQNRFRAFFWPF